MNSKRLGIAVVIAALSLFGRAVLYPTATPESAASPWAAGSDAASRAQQGLAFVEQARDEANPTLLTSADNALRTSLKLQPDGNLPAFVGMAALANARHDFRGSVTWSRRAIELSPYSAPAYGLLGDALFELGRERAAAAAYQDMIDLRPDTASYVRASYTQQHQGRTRAALNTMRQALEAAGPAGESAAFIRHQMGDILAAQGRHAAAERQNRIGSNIAPGFIPPIVGVAESLIATGRMRAAVPLLERAVAGLPTLEYLTTLGDVYTAIGRDTEASAMYSRAEEVLTAYRDNGVQPDADFIVFYADHGVRLDAAVREAFGIYRDRPTAKVADALGWVLHKAGRSDEARRFARHAARAHTAGAQEYFHAAQIERATGDQRRAVRNLRMALRLDPGFSLVDAPVARRQLQEWQ